MVETWATSGFDLHLDVSGTRVRGALERALRDAVATGRLHPGVRLPSSRTLAQDLGIARNTVAEAYVQLVAEGWLTAERGSGTRVAQRVVPPAEPLASSATLRPPIRYDLRSGWPDLSSFPRTVWLAAARRALTAAPSEAFGYTDPRGRPELRRALAGYLSRVRGVRASADRIVICSGFTQALGLLCQVLAARGATRIAVEQYGHRHHRDVVRANRLVPVPIAVDDSGAVIEEIGPAGAVLLTPAHQFPIGVPLVARRRTQAVAWAASRGAVVIEDDYDGEFRYDRQPVGAMQALAPENVVYAGTASKTLAPGVRLAWLVLPGGLVEEVTEAKVLADRFTSSIDQLTLAELIESGDYDRHVRRCRLGYRRRRDQLTAAVARQAPDVRVTGVAAGLHAVLELPPRWGEDEIVARAAARGLALEGLSGYRADGYRAGGYQTGGEPRPAALVVGFGTPPPHAFTTAVARLCAVLTDVAS